MSNGKFDEAELERAIIELFEREGYEHLNGDEIHTPDEILLPDDLRKFISTRYADENLTAAELEKIINKLSLINSAPLYAGNREAFFLVNEGFDLPRDDTSKVALHVEYINFDAPNKNIFKVVNQFSVQGERLRRPDLLIFINGIPIAICEFKSATREDTTIHDAWEQIFFRYRRDIPKLLRYSFLAVISDGANTKLGSIFTPYEKFFAWNKIGDDEKSYDGINSLFMLIRGAFAKERILQILRDFIFYPDDDSRAVAIVCRYPQFFAATKMLANIKEHLRPIGDGKGGTYFGATGCGKTYTMLFLARLIIQRDNETFRNPTIIILTDREDLDTQTSELFVTAKKFLHEQDVRSIESRADLQATLKNRPSGGVYVITIQKFCEELGELSARENIICFSDEAHRTQTNIGLKLKTTGAGIFTTYGFAHYLRKSFPNATYCGFTGTPIDETLKVFGDVVDSYTMKESCDDGITVRIAYEPRLARVVVSDEQARAIEKYYDLCADEGSTDEQINASKIAMSKMTKILSHPERIKKLAADIVEHYERLCAEKPKVVQKAMIVCADRKIALKVLQEIIFIRPDWSVAKKSDDEKILPLPKINLVATQGQNDSPELFNLCGTKDYRKKLDKQFKNDTSNFKIAVVVDMWITGFDVPSLAVMYIDKPLQKHTLIQTISRVNRVFDGKDKGLVVDYIGFKNAMLEAVKKYGSPQESPIDELKISLALFRNYLALLSELTSSFDTEKFFVGTPLERLNCLNAAAEFVQIKKNTELRFMSLSKKLKAAYMIVFPSGELNELEISKTQFFLAVRSIIFKQTKGTAPDAEIMNRVVEKMVEEALNCTGIKNIVSDEKAVDLFSEDFLRELNAFKMPVTKFNALLKLAKKNIAAYGRSNKIKSIEFDKRLKKIVDEYNSRDKLVFVNEVVSDFVDQLSDKLIELLQDIEGDKKSFERLGEEKIFFDILVAVRESHAFPYADEKCLALAKEIKKLVDSKSRFTDWTNRSDIKAQLESDLTVILYKHDYPPEWDKEVFEKIIEQTENFRRYSEDA